ncbi:MAG TPA: SCO family protein [Azonexus sp.]|nr:SCO family protein [Azonexus sp.]
MKRHHFLFAIAAALAIFLAAALFLVDREAPASKLPAGGDFVLHAVDGPFDTKTLRGKVLLVYFGYTSCPDICPTTLSTGAQALALLTAEERARVRMVMISVDPERDSLAHLAQYATFFHPALLGVSGSPEEVAAVLRQFGANYRKGPVQPDGSYAIDHTTATYVVDAEGKLVSTLNFGSTPEQVVAAVRQYL